MWTYTVSFAISKIQTPKIQNQKKKIQKYKIQKYKIQKYKTKQKTKQQQQFVAGRARVPAVAANPLRAGKPPSL